MTTLLPVGRANRVTIASPGTLSQAARGGRTAHDVTVRELTGAAVTQVEELSRAVYGEHHATATEWRHAPLPREGVRRYVARSGAGEAFHAYGCLWTEPWLEHRRCRRLELLVHPRERGRGFGEALYAQLWRDFTATGTPTLEAYVRLEQTEAIGFLERRGFRKTGRDWNLRLPVSEADLSGVGEALDRVRAHGVTVTTLAEERERNPHCLRDVHALCSVIEAEQVAPAPWTPTPFVPFTAWLQRQEAMWGACFLAKRDGEYVAISMLTCRQDQPSWLFQNATGTQRDYRRRGIALALKLCGIAYAREHGYRTIHTTNASRHPGILALNHQLGFCPDGGHVTLQRGQEQ